MPRGPYDALLSAETLESVQGLTLLARGIVGTVYEPQVLPGSRAAPPREPLLHALNDDEADQPGGDRDVFQSGGILPAGIAEIEVIIEGNQVQRLVINVYFSVEGRITEVDIDAPVESRQKSLDNVGRG